MTLKDFRRPLLTSIVVAGLCLGSAPAAHAARPAPRDRDRLEVLQVFRQWWAVDLLGSLQHLVGELRGTLDPNGRD